MPTLASCCSWGPSPQNSTSLSSPANLSEFPNPDLATGGHPLLTPNLKCITHPCEYLQNDPAEADINVCWLFSHFFRNEKNESFKAMFKASLSCQLFFLLPSPPVLIITMQNKTLLLGTYLFIAMVVHLF